MSNIRTERDDLLQETDELRARCDLMDKQVEEMRMALVRRESRCVSRRANSIVKG